MTEEEKTNIEQADSGAENAVDQPKAQSSLMKYLMFGGGLIVLVALAAYGTLVFVGDEPQTAETPAVEQQQAAPAESKPDIHELAKNDDIPADVLDSLMAIGDQSAFEKIQQNLDFLDYKPTEDELATEEEKLAKQDSIREVNWIESEKLRLAALDKDLTKRQRELERLDKDVSAKLAKLDQAESARIVSLAKLYDGMDARAVAALMANLDDGTIVALLPRMKNKNASAVLALLPPVRAAKLSKQMITIAGN